MTGARGQPPTPLGNMHFRLEIDGIAGGGAVEIILPEARIAPTRRVRYGPLIVRRGLTLARDWYEWWDAARRGRRPPRRSLRIVLLDSAGGDTAVWMYRDALPVAYHLSPLNALGNEAVLETLELSVGNFEAAPGGTNADRPKVRRRTAR
ncbi:MAG TPA: phage tail protein [Vineibacter sp.]|nr:phage tail protein [Vineibacter sp.]